jgi:hypothetical protein
MKALMKACVMLLAALWACAALAGSSGGARGASHMENVAILLDLTDAQKPQVQTILAGAHTQMRQLFEQTKAAGGKPDFQALHAARQQIQQDTLTKLSTVLSPAQLKKFQALEQMHRHGFGRHGAPGAAAPAASGTSAN